MTQELTNFDQLTIQSDFIFKKVMSRKRICKHLLEELLQIKIADISYPEVEHTLDVYYDSRGIRLNIIVADDKKTHYNLETQVKNPVDSLTQESLLPKRTRYYQAMLDVDALQKGQDFDKLPPTFVIFICMFDLFRKEQRLYTFKKRCLEKPGLELNDQATVVFLNTKGTQGEVSKDIQSFCDYINNNIVTSEFTDEIDKTIVDVKYDKKVRKEFMLYEIRMKDLRNEALAEGMAKGEAKGMAEGMKKGITQGITEGILKGKINAAKSFLRMGLPAAQVAQGTGLTAAEVQRLQAELEAEKAQEI